MKMKYYLIGLLMVSTVLFSFTFYQTKPWAVPEKMPRWQIRSKAMLKQLRLVRNCGLNIVRHVTVKPEQAMGPKLRNWKRLWKKCQHQLCKDNRTANFIIKSLRVVKKCLLLKRKSLMLKTYGQWLIILEALRSNSREETSLKNLSSTRQIFYFIGVQ